MHGPLSGPGNAQTTRRQSTQQLVFGAGARPGSERMTNILMSSVSMDAGHWSYRKRGALNMRRFIFMAFITTIIMIPVLVVIGMSIVSIIQAIS